MRRPKTAGDTMVPKRLYKVNEITLSSQTSLHPKLANFRGLCPLCQASRLLLVVCFQASRLLLVVCLPNKGNFASMKSKDTCEDNLLVCWCFEPSQPQGLHQRYKQTSVHLLVINYTSYDAFHHENLKQLSFHTLHKKKLYYSNTLQIV